MHKHQLPIPEWVLAVGDWMDAVIIGFWVGMVLFIIGLPIPIGYDRGKIAWMSWCGTGMHAHRVYLTDHGFQTLHPKDQNKEET